MNRSPVPAADPDASVPARAARLSLVAELASRADALTGRALRAMYENPFWDERFGERGRRFAESDGRHHLAYLSEALRSGSAGGMVWYARWLQRVLLTRGMCSRHLGEHFARLAEAIRAEGVPDAALALDYLRAAEDALLHHDVPAAREIQEQVGAAPLADADRAEPASLHYYGSYLADAVALDRPALFGDYVRWTAEHLARRGEPPSRLAARLAELDARVARLSPAAREGARRALDAGRAAAGTA